MRPAFAALGALMLWPVAARAQSTEPSPGATEQALPTGAGDEARAAFETGLAALQDGRFADARVALERSYALRRVPSVCLNLGLALRGLGRLVEARARFREFQSTASPTLRAQFDADVAGYLDGIARSVAHVHLAAPVPARAAVTLDGAPALFDDDGDIAVDPGTHVVAVASAGYAAASQTVDAPSGARIDVRFALRAADAGPIALVAIAADHRARDALRAAGWTGLGVGVLLATGGALALDAQWNNADFWNGTGPGQCGPSGQVTTDRACTGARDAANTFGALAIAGFAVGALAGVAGVAMLLAAPAVDHPRRVRAMLGCHAVLAAGVACDGWSL